MAALAVAAAIGIAGQRALAVPVHWNVHASSYSYGSVTGSLTFDDSTGAWSFDFSLSGGPDRLSGTGSFFVLRDGAHGGVDEMDALYGTVSDDQAARIPDWDTSGGYCYAPGYCVGPPVPGTSVMRLLLEDNTGQAFDNLTYSPSGQSMPPEIPPDLALLSSREIVINFATPPFCPNIGQPCFQSGSIGWNIDALAAPEPALLPLLLLASAGLAVRVRSRGSAKPTS
jgi:hypothetical protein